MTTKKFMKYRGHYPAYALIILFIIVTSACALPLPRVRPSEWAVPVPSQNFTNLYKINTHLYRSEQPTAAGFRELKKMGIAAVLNLRECHSDAGAAAGSGLRLYHLKLSPSSITTEDIVKALRIIRAEKGAVLIHCLHGSDRTGAVSAAYRIVFQNWSMEAAVDELRRGGYGFHSIFENIPELIFRINAVELRKELGVR